MGRNKTHKKQEKAKINLSQKERYTKRGTKTTGSAKAKRVILKIKCVA
jgi:hypothetical protein